MPGGSPYGVVIEKPMGNFPNIVAHALGHYLNLDQVNDRTDVMNPVIDSGSTRLTRTQCNTARSAANYFWTRMQR